MVNFEFDKDFQERRRNTYAAVIYLPRELNSVVAPFREKYDPIYNQVDAHINKVIELGFARRLRGQEQMVEVRRILKAFVDAQWLNEFDVRLQAYQAQLSADGESV